MSNSEHYRKFCYATGWIYQVYRFSYSCLPEEDNIKPGLKVSGFDFGSSHQLHAYQNELAYSLLLRLFGALEQFCNSLGLKDQEIPRIIESSSLSSQDKEDYTHIRKLRNVISHGNGVGELTRTKYSSYERDCNGYLLIKTGELDSFLEVIKKVAKELNQFK